MGLFVSKKIDYGVFDLEVEVFVFLLYLKGVVNLEITCLVCVVTKT